MFTEPGRADAPASPLLPTHSSWGNARALRALGPKESRSGDGKGACTGPEMGFSGLKSDGGYSHMHLVILGFYVCLYECMFLLIF